MATEIEYKFKIDDLLGIISKLNSIAKQTINRQYQLNVMFDNRQGEMAKTNGRIRVRTIGESGQKVLTYKKPIENLDGAKREIEHEIEFSDKNGDIEMILDRMGYSPTTSYERHRSEWLNNDVSIAVDEYPFANFLEIEGGIDKIKTVVKQIGLEEKDGLTDPADTLFQKWRKENNLPFKPHMRFDDFDKE